MGITILGLGTNVGDREGQLAKAINALAEILTDMKCSPVYECKALLDEGAPKEWDSPFLNMAVRGETALAPHALLEQLQAIEKSLGRTQRGHWGPREIDIDILAYANEVIMEEALIIPHLELLKRDFALIPLADIAPDWVYPQAAGKTARQLAADLPSSLTKTDIVFS